jgi:hypothetical protein
MADDVQTMTGVEPPPEIAASISLARMGTESLPWT